MKKFKTPIALLLAGTMTLSLVGCQQNSSQGSTGTGDGDTTPAPDISFSEAEERPIDKNAPTGNLIYLTYEGTWDTENEEKLAKFEKEYGGTVEIRKCGSGDEYFQALGTFIAAGDSPDLVRYEWRSFPHAISYNVYTPLDSYIDINSDLWKDMKPIADQFMYNGKHYYFPNVLKTNFALNYNNRALMASGMTDPMELLKKNEWTWTAFEDMLKRWVDMDPANHIGYNGVGGMIFVLTTGKKTIDVSNNEIINNLKDADVTRCMSWLGDMRKNGLLGASAEKQAATGHSNGYEDPGTALIDGNLLFLGMDPSWAYGAAKEKFFNEGMEEEIKFVPFPRDDNSDTYYHGIDTLGYMVPSGAPNLKGAIDWINFAHSEEVDPENLAKAKGDALAEVKSYKAKCMNKDCGDTSDNADSKGRHIYTEEENANNVTVCPVCGTARETKFKLVWTEEQYDLWMELKSTTGRFTMLFDNCYGFSSDVSNLFQSGETPLLDGPVFSDGLTYTSIIDSQYAVVEGYLAEYREIMKKNAAGEEVTLDWAATKAPETSASSTTTGA